MPLALLLSNSNFHQRFGTVAAAFGGAIWFGGGLKFSVTVLPPNADPEPIQLSAPKPPRQ